MIGSLLERHQRIGLDSNVLIYLLEGSGELADRAAELLDALGAGTSHGVMSTLALAEICSGPARDGQAALLEHYADELQTIENLRIVPLSAEIAVDAAVVRGARTTSLADAIHLATARHAGATVFVTNDRQIKSINRLDVVYLDEL